MDRLSQLGFVTSELLLNLEQPRKRACDDRAIVLFNHTSSGWVDKEYAQTIRHRDSYFPSPSLFVYTLPNIVCGEVALRHGYHAETSFYMMDSKNEAMMDDILQSTFSDHTIHSIIAGWIDYQDEQTFEADFKLLSRI
jgi:3-oxoacyl-[acyl-carrier-protein] synthase-1